MFFRKGKRCPSCDATLSPDWSFCPSCGEPLSECKRETVFPGFIGFGDIFKQMDRQMAEMDKLFAQPMKVPRLVMRPGGSGISISITSGTGQKPNISVRTFGGAKKLEPQIKQQLGFGGTVQEVVGKPKAATRPRVTEEPEMKVRREGSNVIYEIDLPGVTEKNIEIRRLPNSIEIRAVAGSKLYFKLFEAPPDLSIMDRRFEDGTLTLVLG